MAKSFVSQARADAVTAAVADIDWESVDVVLRAAHSVDLAHWIDYDPEVHDARWLAHKAQQMALQAVENYVSSEGDCYGVNNWCIDVNITETAVDIEVRTLLDCGTSRISNQEAVREYALRLELDEDYMAREDDNDG